MSRTATPREHLRSVARGGVLNLIGAAVSSLAGLALTIVVARVVPQATAGVYFSVTALFVVLAMVGRLGSGTGLVYFTSRMRSLGRYGDIRVYTRIATRPAALVSVAVAVALLVSAPWLAGLVAPGHDGPATSYIRQIAVFLPFAILADLFHAVTRGYGTMRPTTAIDKIGRPLLQITLVGTAGVLGGGLLTGGWAAPYLPAALLSVWWLSRLRHTRNPSRARLRRRDPRPDALPSRPVGELRREYWSYALPRAFAGIAQVALQRLDIILVGAIRGPVDAAVYAAATRFLVVGQLANQAISMAVQPRIAGLLAVDDRRRTNEVYRTSTAWLVLMAWPLYLLVAVFSPQILLLFGHGYAAGRTVMLVLAASMLVATACGMVDVMLTMAGRTRWSLANVGTALVVNVGLNLLLIPRFGIDGAAIAWAVAILVTNVVPLAQVWHAYGLHPFDRGMLTACALAAGCFGVLPLVALLASGGTLPALLAGAVAGLVAYAAALWRLRRTLHLDLLLAALRHRR
ncbi:MAG TPA: polysaccharide biosynthesis C-terminal domain-containing protein [Streptosporangiales bacterium]